MTDTITRTRRTLDLGEQRRLTDLLMGTPTRRGLAASPWWRDRILDAIEAGEVRGVAPGNVPTSTSKLLAKLRQSGVWPLAGHERCECCGRFMPAHHVSRRRAWDDRALCWRWTAAACDECRIAGMGDGWINLPSSVTGVVNETLRTYGARPAPSKIRTRSIGRKWTERQKD